MPKQPANIPKSKRIEVVKEILMRWGRIKMHDINIRVANNLGCDPRLIKRAIYRDLEELVTTCQVKELVFTRDGREILDYDPDLHKNVYKEWCIPTSDISVIGQSLLHAKGARIYCKNFITREISVHEGRTDTRHHVKYIFFELSSCFMSIQVNIDALPISFVISREMGPISTEEIETVHKRDGIRSVILKLPISNLSSFKDSNKLGHGKITLSDTNHVNLKDLGSSNGTYFYKISNIDAEELRAKGQLIGDKTISDTWSSLNNIKVEREDVNDDDILSPVIVEMSEKMRLLII
ncbi:MAG: hypothetical protein ISR65_19240 [Bacteriovoracaceae bacterium]|nr:hypothetical protein [Bacteriovoracaceae bacterium]